LNSSPRSPPQAEAPGSSPGTQSPEIEVAELEDMEGYNGPTVWRSNEHTFAFEDLEAALLEDFPMTDDYTNFPQALQKTMHTMNRGRLRGSIVSLKVAICG
jgi:hypothetical protein